MAEREGKSRFVQVWCWIYVVSYLLTCIYISLAVGENLVDWIGSIRSSWMIVVAFALCCLSVLVSLVTFLALLWEFQTELRVIV